MSPHLRLVEERSADADAGVGTGAALLDGAVVVPRHGTESLTGVERHDLDAHRAPARERPRRPCSPRSTRCT